MIRSNKGFTLIELLVVISIIGVLSSVALVSVRKGAVKARDARRKADLLIIKKALETYKELYGNQYPYEGICDSSIGSCAACPCSPVGLTWSATSGISTLLLNNNILKKIPIDPINDSAYYYTYEPDGSGQGTPPCVNKYCRYVLGARLEETGSWYYLYSVTQE